MVTLKYRLKNPGIPGKIHTALLLQAREKRRDPQNLLQAAP